MEYIDQIQIGTETPTIDFSIGAGIIDANSNCMRANKFKQNLIRLLITLNL